MSLLLGSNEGTAMRARALKRYIEDQQASSRTVYPTYDPEENCEFRIMGSTVREPAQNDSPRVTAVLLGSCLVNTEKW